jgi:predicted TIM-barrel fold metal-dependent hydrolase
VADAGGRRVLDADAHVVEPAGLFGDDAPPGVAFLDLPPTTPMIPCGDPDAVADQMEHGFDAASYLRALDREGIDAVVLYPSIGLFVPFQPAMDAHASARACRAYNDWIASYSAEAPARLHGVGLVPLVDVELAADEARRCADLGLVGVLARPNYVYGRTLGSPENDVFYDVLEDTGLVLAVHEGLGLPGGGSTIGGDRFTGFALRHACSHPLEQMTAMASLFLEGACERHPSLRVAFLESGTGWLPYWLSRLDDHREWLAGSECSGLSLAPSEYFSRQCVISTDPEDDLVSSVIPVVGADHVMWASDFPHPDALFPNAVTSFEQEAGEHGLGGEELATVLWDTAVRFYRLDG